MKIEIFSTRVYDSIGGVERAVNGFLENPDIDKDSVKFLQSESSRSITITIVFRSLNVRKTTLKKGRAVAKK